MPAQTVGCSSPTKWADIFRFFGCMAKLMTNILATTGLVPYDRFPGACDYIHIAAAVVGV